MDLVRGVAWVGVVVSLLFGLGRPVRGDETEALRRFLGKDYDGAKLVAMRRQALTIFDLKTRDVKTLKRYPGKPYPYQLIRPLWSTDGEEFILAEDGECYIYSADGSERRRILEGESVWEPSFWDDPKTGERCVVYKTIEGEHWYPRDEGVGATYLYRPRSGTRTKLAGFPFDGGLSRDGTHLGEAYGGALIMDLETGRVHILNRGRQACHGSTSPDNTYRLMHLDLRHQRILIHDKFGNLLFQLLMPEGRRRWQTPRWANRADFGAAVARFRGGDRIVLFKTDTGEVLVLQDLGSGWTYPHLWLPSGAGEVPLRPSPIADLPLEKLVAYKTRLADAEDYSPILAELKAGDEPEAALIVETLEALGRKRLAEARTCEDPFLARGIYRELAARFRGHAIGREARGILDSEGFKKEIAAARTLERLIVLAGQLDRLRPAEIRRFFGGGGSSPENNPLLGRMANLVVEIRRQFPETHAARQAKKIAEKHNLPDRTFDIDKGRVVVVAAIEETSVPLTLAQIAPYRDALICIVYRVEEVLEGRCRSRRLNVMHWSIRDGRTMPAAAWKPGLRQRLTADLFESHPELESVMASLDAWLPRARTFWALEVREPAE